jgi:two-component sensor histidine kinase
MSLSMRLLLLVAAVLGPLIAVEGYLQLDLRRSREIEVRAQVQQTAARVAAQEEQVIEGVKQLLRTLVELNEIRDRDAAGCTRLLENIRPHFEGFLAFVVTDTEGGAFCVTTPPTPTAIGKIGLGDRNYFIEAMRTGSFAAGTYSRGRFTHKNMQAFALPYLDRAGKPGGIVGLSLDLDWLGNQFDGAQWTDRQALVIADRNGTILVRRPHEEGYIGKPVAAEIWDRARQLQTPSSIDITSVADGQPRIAGIVPPSAGPAGMFIAVGVNRAAAFHDLEAAVRGAGIATGLAVLASLAFAWLFGRKLIKEPVEALLATSRQWRNGDYTARSGMTGSSDIQELGHSLDEMAEALEEALRHKDMLLRELSHRVMNSLQTIAGLFALQGRQLTDPDAKKQFSNAVRRINSVALAYRRMQAEAGVELIDFAEFLRELCADLHRSMMSESLPYIVEADPVILGTDQAMPLALVVNELVTNALKHGTGEVPVTIKLGRSNNGCRLAVRNGGALLPHYDPAATTGFGMQMVNRIVSQLNGKLEASTMGGETEFAITFVPKEPQPTILTVVASKSRRGV